MPEIPGPLGQIINVGGHVGNEQVTQRGWTTYVGPEPISSDGGYLGNSKVVQDRAGRIWVDNRQVSSWGGSNYLGPDKITR